MALRRRSLLAAPFIAALGPARAETRRWRIGFANLDETPGTTLDGLGFTGIEVRRSFELAARTLPIDMLYFDNAGNPVRAIANADAAIAARVDLLIDYNADADANATIARRLADSGIHAIALVNPLPGAPLYGPDNVAAGRIAGHALAQFARDEWGGETVRGVLIGDLADPTPAVRDRVRGIEEGVHAGLPDLTLTPLDTGGHSARAEALLTRLLQTQRGRLLIATLDDMSAIHARNAIDLARRQSDCAIVSQGVDRNIHGGASEKKEIDPANRGSVVLGSVAYFMDRYGYEVLPLALRLLNGETVPLRTITEHRLITAATVFREYPPFDMN